MTNTCQMRFKLVSNGIWNWNGIVQGCHNSIPQMTTYLTLDFENSVDQL
jgi:hypothetical protein